MAKSIALMQSVTGRNIAINTALIEVMEDMGDGEIHIYTASDWYRVRGDFQKMYLDWSVKWSKDQ